MTAANAFIVILLSVCGVVTARCVTFSPGSSLQHTADKIAEWRFYADAVHFANQYDLHPNPAITFPNATAVFFTGCDKNTFYYWLRMRTFPKVVNIWLNSPTSDVFEHRDNACYYLTPRYHHHQMKIGASCVILLEEAQYERELESRGCSDKIEVK